jgi:hypothetical protein
MTRFRLIASLATLALLVAVAATATAGAAPAAKRSCHLSSHDQRHLGASYVTSLSVRHTSCSKGKKVTKAYNKCRHRHGGANGHCHQAVKGYRCSENRFDVLPGVQYSAKVKCHNGKRRVRFTYTENT